MQARDRRSPLALFWFLYMAGLGLVFPYQSLYFHENAALAGTQLGLVLAMRPLMGMVFQPVWGYLADRSGLRAQVLTILAVGTAVAYALLPLAQGFVWLLAAVAFSALFSTSVIPMATSASMASLGERAAERFGHVRVWGTVGFLVLVVSFPWILSAAQRAGGLSAQPAGHAEPGLGLIFPLAAVLTLAAAAVSLRLPRGGAMGLRARPGELAKLLRHGPYLRILGFTFLAYFLLQAPILLFPLLVRARGGDLETLSTLWIPMLILEIPLVFLAGATLRRFGARSLLAVGVAADGVRWLVSGLVPDLRVLYALQLLHGVVVAGLIVGILLYVEMVVPERLRSTGQGLVAMVGISLASVLSSVQGGALLEHVGTEAPYLVGGGGALLLAAAVPWLLPRPERQAG
jgi:MFS transporter, PPP family, 3-phenylpropionic acid transporter